MSVLQQIGARLEEQAVGVFGSAVWIQVLSSRFVARFSFCPSLLQPLIKFIAGSARARQRRIDAWRCRRVRLLGLSGFRGSDGVTTRYEDWNAKEREAALPEKWEFAGHWVYGNGSWQGLMGLNFFDGAKLLHMPARNQGAGSSGSRLSEGRDNHIHGFSCG